MEDIPLKKRRLWHLSLSSPAQTCLPATEESRSSRFGDSFQHLGETDQLLDISFPLSQKSESNIEIGASDDSVAVQSVDCPSEVRNEEYAEKRAEISIAKIPLEGVVASLDSRDLVKKDSVHVVNKGLVVQDDSSTSNYNDENGGAFGTSKPNRLHWDLNTTMEEWEEPNVETFNSRINHSEYLLNNEMQSGMVTSEVSGVQKDAVGIQCDIGGSIHSLSSSQVSSDQDRSQKIENPQCMVVQARSPELVRHVLQVCSGAINTEKTSSVLETKAPTTFISMDNLHTCDCPRSDHINCTTTEGSINTSVSMLVQYEKDISKTPAAVLCKSSSHSGLVEKTENVDKSSFYADSIKYEGSKDFERESGEDPTNCSGKLTSEDPSSGCNSSIVSENNQGDLIRVEKMSNLQLGYDSPIEDGELREPAVYSWGNDEVECSETGQLDNGSIDTNHIHSSEKSCDNGNQFSDNQEDANVQNHELKGKSIETGEFRARRYKQKVPSHIGTHNTDPVKRNCAYMQRQRSDPLLLSQAKKEIDYQCSFRKNFSFPEFGKNETSHRQVDFSIPYHEPRTFYTRNYRGRKDLGYSPPRRVVGNPTEGKLNCYDDRASVNDIYRPSTRRRLQAERDISRGGRRREPPSSGSRDTYNKETETHTQSGKRTPKEEYYLSRRESGFSSNFGGAAHVIRPQRNSQSESCLLSPSSVSREQTNRRFSSRMARQSQTDRAKYVEFPRRLKSDDNLRSFIRRKRNSQGVAAAAGRRCSFEDNGNDRNIYDDKFEMNGRVQRYESKGKLKRVQHYADDSCKFNRVQDDCSTNTHRSGVPSIAKGPSRYSSDRIATTFTSREQELKEAPEQMDVPKTGKKW